MGKELPILELLQGAFDATESVRFIVAEDGEVLHFNRKAYENSILIHQKELKPGDNLFDFAADTANKVENKLRNELKRTFRGETFVTESEIKYDRESRWFMTEYVPIVQRRKVVAASISTFEITEKKKEELLRDQVLLEVKTSNQNRLQQIEFVLDALLTTANEVAVGCARGDDPRLPQKMRALHDDIKSLRNKVHAWSKHL